MRFWNGHKWVEFDTSDAKVEPIVEAILSSTDEALPSRTLDETLGPIADVIFGEDQPTPNFVAHELTATIVVNDVNGTVAQMPGSTVITDEVRERIRKELAQREQK